MTFIWLALRINIGFYSNFTNKEKAQNYRANSSNKVNCISFWRWNSKTSLSFWWRVMAFVFGSEELLCFVKSIWLRLALNFNEFVIVINILISWISESKGMLVFLPKVDIV